MQQQQYPDLHSIRKPRACKRMRPPTTEPQPAKRTRKSRAASMAEMNYAVEQQNAAMYNQPSQMPQQSQPNYMRPEYEQSRYNTRSAMPTLHNLPLSQAPTMSKYWTNNAMKPGTSYCRNVQPPQLPTPPQPPPPPPPAPIITPMMKEVTIQTEFNFTEDEYKFMESFHAKNLDMKRIKSIIDRVDYITAYEKKDSKEMDILARISKINPWLAAIMYSRAYRQAGMAAVQMSMSMLPALQYNPPPQIQPNHNEDASEQQEDEEEIQEQEQAEDLSMQSEEQLEDDNNNLLTETQRHPQIPRLERSNRMRQRPGQSRTGQRDFNHNIYRNAHRNQQKSSRSRYNNMNRDMNAEMLQAAAMLYCNSPQMNYCFPPRYMPPFSRMPPWAPFTNMFHRPRPPWP